MNLHEWAKTILLGDTLEDKLCSPPNLTDTTRSPTIHLPTLPGRPSKLRLCRTPHQRATVFPTAHQLASPESRGIALHFFMNHELLATELMALTLLKFPEAPRGFRTGITKALREEQAHMKMYMRRMESLGVGVGDVPVNGFFWERLSAMATPMDFVVQMSLTFEQANLDYTLYYEALMTEHEDLSTAKILRKVYEDEITHVRHGLHWFNRWRPPDESEWDSYTKLLGPRLSPVRAKGPRFSIPARQKVGLSKTFVDHLMVFSASKGRPADIFLFNPGCEEELGKGLDSKLVKMLAQDLSILLAFLAKPSDIVLSVTRPRSEFLLELQELGFVLPEFLTPSGLAKRLKAHRLHGALRPWAQTDSATRMLETSGIKDVPPFNNDEVFSKAWAKNVLAEFISKHPRYQPFITPPWAVGRTCQSTDEVFEEQKRILGHGHESVVIKAPFSTSGRHRKRLLPGYTASPDDLRWIKRMLRRQGPLVVEPWFHAFRDLSIVIPLVEDENDELRLLRFFTNPKGQYLGHVLAPPLLGCPAQLLRGLSEVSPQKNLMSLFKDITSHTQKCLIKEGYRGPAGIDILVYTDAEDQPRIHPIVEINPRWTMGHVAHALRARLAPRSTGVWAHLPRKSLAATGYSSFSAWARALLHALPPKTEERGGQTKVKSGAVMTNDPTEAQSVLTVLVAHENLAHLQGDLRRWFPDPAFHQL